MTEMTLLTPRPAHVPDAPLYGLDIGQEADPPSESAGIVYRVDHLPLRWTPTA
jgi:hypothetical protein